MPPPEPREEAEAAAEEEEEVLVPLPSFASGWPSKPCTAKVSA